MRVDSARLGDCAAYEAPSREELCLEEGGLATLVVSWSLRATPARAACCDADIGLVVACDCESDLDDVLGGGTVLEVVA